MQQTPQGVTAERIEREVMERALRRMRLNFYHLWKPLNELCSSDSPDTLLEEWRGAQWPSQEWRKAHCYERAVDVLAVALDRTREEAELAVSKYTNEPRRESQSQ
jgi:hypothetical protein